MGSIPIPRKPPRQKGESEIVRRIREAAGALEGVVLFRNNTGMLEDRHGTKVRFGLCEGSADLVGMVDCWVTGQTTGQGYAATTKIHRIGRFIAIEVKQPGEKPTKEQTDFLDLVASMGGYACWVDSVESALAHVALARQL